MTTEEAVRIGPVSHVQIEGRWYWIGIPSGRRRAVEALRLAGRHRAQIYALSSDGEFHRLPFYLTVRGQ